MSDPSTRRPAWPGELAVVLFFLVVYDRIAGLARVDVEGAEARGRALLALEDRWHLAVERALDGGVAPHHLLSQVLSVYYDFAHLSVALAVGLLLWLRAPQAYRRARNALVAVNAVAFTVFVLAPVAPPRLVPGAGIADVVADSGTWGAWTDLEGVAAHAAEYASMPSLHLAWSVWVALAVASLTTRRSWRLLAVAHVATTAVVVLATGNHYLLDLPAGALLTAGAWALTRPRTVPLPAGGVLVVSASMGAGHDGVAYELARRWEQQGTPVRVVDFLDLMPLGTGRLIKAVYGAQLAHAPASYEWLYSAIERKRSLDVTTGVVAGWARGRLLRRARRDQVRLVVATYPLAGRALGLLRREQRLAVPAVTFLTDVEVHASWLDRGTDLYLAVYEGSADAATARTGCPARSTGPVLPPHLSLPLQSDERTHARTTHGLADEARPVALLVTGSWGVGPVRGAALRLRDAGVLPVVLCGRNEALRAELDGVEGVRAVGWTTDVRSLYAAADVVVHNAGGLSSLEAMAAGVPVVGYACLPGHGDRNARTMAAAGVAGYAEDEADLVRLVHEAATPAGRAQALRARELFTADPVDVLREVQPLRAAAGLGAARLRRRLATLAVTAPLVLAMSAGVSEATERGFGVTRAPSGADVWVAVRVDPAELADPATARLLAAYGVSALLDESTAPLGRGLTSAGVTVVASLPHGHGLRHRYGTVLAAETAALGAPVAGLVSTEGLGGLSLTAAHLDHLEPGVATPVTDVAALRPRAGQQLVLELAPRDLRSGLAALRRAAAAAQLSVQPLAALWPSP